MKQMQALFMYVICERSNTVSFNQRVLKVPRGWWFSTCSAIAVNKLMSFLDDFPLLVFLLHQQPSDSVFLRIPFVKLSRKGKFFRSHEDFYKSYPFNML